MSKKRLQLLKTLTTWGGVITTTSGVTLTLYRGGSVVAACLSYGGVLLTCFGHLLTTSIARCQAAEQAAEQEKLKRDRARVDRRIDRMIHGSGGAAGYDIEDQPHDT